jgi:hypothetical protein
MENKIKWEANLSAAIVRAKGENKPVFLFFHNPD